MSSHGDATPETTAPSTVAGSNDDHLPPEETLAADEQATPAWLPLLGLALALVALLLFLGWTSEDKDPGAAETSAPEPAAQPAPDEGAARRAPPPRPRRPDPGHRGAPPPPPSH